MTYILWVEDQFHWIDKLTSTLESTDFGDGAACNQIQTFKFAEAACQHIKLAKKAPDIALLDANMNGNDNAGFSVSRALCRKWPGIPIIYLSEHSGTSIEQQALEDAETQDFIAKHQQNIESVLCWRIKATLRQHAIKQNAGNSLTKPLQQDIIQSGQLSIDLTTWDVYWWGTRLMNPTNAKRPLPPMPRKILRYLVESSPLPLTTQQMEEKLEADKFNYANYRQHIKTLRHSFEQVSHQLNKE